MPSRSRLFMLFMLCSTGLRLLSTLTQRNIARMAPESLLIALCPKVETQWTEVGLLDCRDGDGDDVDGDSHQPRYSG